MDNTKLLQGLVDCWNTGHLGPLDQILAPNFVRHEADLEARASNHDDYKQIITHLRGMLVDFQTEAADVIEQGNKVAFRFRTTGKHNNSVVVFEGVNILHIQGGKIVENWVYYDATGLQQELGLRQATSAS
jgi:ketosteroid isomerase-like protein